MQQRYYDQGVGRFLSVDPVSASSINGGNFNRYWYANNNPYKFIDPDGRIGVCKTLIVCTKEEIIEEKQPTSDPEPKPAVGVQQSPNDAASGESETDDVPDGGPSGDLFTVIDMDLVGITGAEFTFGSVLDLDSPLDSGYYWSFNQSMGANVGFGLGGGYALRDIEGKGAGLDLNMGKFSASILADDKGFHALALTVGPGVGLSGSVGTTRTLTLRKILQDLRVMDAPLED